jgi:hypothetical protein
MLLIVLCITMIGCQTLGDARAAKGKGTSRPIAASKDRVWSVLPKAMNEVDLSIAGTYPEEGYILGERGVSMFSWGEKVAVYVTPLDSNRTEVEVVSMRSVAVNITASEFGKKLLDMIERMLQSE